MQLNACLIHCKNGTSHQAEHSYAGYNMLSPTMQPYTNTSDTEGACRFTTAESGEVEVGCDNHNDWLCHSALLLPLPGGLIAYDQHASAKPTSCFNAF